MSIKTGVDADPSHKTGELSSESTLCKKEKPSYRTDLGSISPSIPRRERCPVSKTSVRSQAKMRPMEAGRRRGKDAAEAHATMAMAMAMAKTTEMVLMCTQVMKLSLSR